MYITTSSELVSKDTKQMTQYSGVHIKGMVSYNDSQNEKGLTLGEGMPHALLKRHGLGQD